MDLVNRAARGDRKALQELKRLHPRREFRRKFCDLHGDTLTWRRKGSSGKWYRMT